MLAARNTKFAADGLNDPQLALMWTESNILIDVECSVNSYYGYKIGMEIVCEKDTIRLPLPAEPIVRSRLKVDNEIMDNWAERFPKAYDNELQHWINHLRSIEPTAGPGNKDGFAACCIVDAMIASQTSEAEIWYDRRRAWFVHRQISPLGRYAGRFRRAGLRLFLPQYGQKPRDR